MSPFRGKVERGVVRLSRKKALPEGQKVIIVPVPSAAKGSLASPEAEQEDVEFVRATRGRLARQLKSENGADA
jgi:hypothetical protein